MDDAANFSERQLPARAAFDSQPRHTECSNEDYAHAQQVWTAFNCQTFADYHHLYLKTDVLLLAYVFSKFRQVCRRTYGVDPAFYVSAQHLSWDAMLLHTDVRLDLISDPTMSRVIDAGIRGGVAMITRRYARASNTKLGHLYDATKPLSTIIYVDCNNLYVWAMSQPLPQSGFRWMDADE